MSVHGGVQSEEMASGDEKAARWAQSPSRGTVVVGSSPAGCALDDPVGRSRSVPNSLSGVTESGEEVGTDG